MWTGYIKSGPLGAAVKLLEDPLTFDSISFVERTYGNRAPVHVELHNLIAVCRAFEDARQSVLSKVGLCLHQLNEESAIVVDCPATLFSTNLAEKVGGISSSATLIEEAQELRFADSVNQVLDRLIEQFELTQRGYKPPSSPELLELIKFYWLSENLYLVFIGIARCELKSQVAVEFKAASTTAKKVLLRKWIANHWESWSNKSNLAFIASAPSGDINSIKAKIYIQGMAENFRDKIFSIPSGTLPDEIASLAPVELASSYCLVIAALIWGKVKAGRDSLNVEEVLGFGVKKESIEILVNICDTMSATDRVIAIEGGELRLLTLSLSYQSRFIVKTAFDGLSKSEMGTFNNRLGKFFESNIKKKLEALEVTKYEVLPEIVYQEKLHGKERIDVDLIVRDIRRNKYLFLQVKYSLAGGMAYLSGDNWYSKKSEDSISDAIRQLKAARALLQSGGLEKSLESINIFDCTSDNTEYLIIHTVNNLDFQLDDSGIAMYEWNTFRNLMDDGRCELIHPGQKEPTEWRYHSALPVESPDKVIELLLEHSPICRKTGATDIKITHDIVTKAKVGQLEVLSEGLAI